ncbi:ABC-three component system protein [Flavobacterium fluviatile]|uniref:ABC-three component system protein n=1 Tax=Flavobacterium fluviatile TaxID=1862387 RepID=UPI0013D6AD13|nr:ABC-three component system protein [Flavobacterium fluviatile]
MDYKLELLDDDKKFERLVNTICEKILGTGVIEFSEGKDGGRDGKFTGTATNFPSSIDSWKGKFIIQAKFTTNSQASCSDSEFEKLMNLEIQSIKKLKENGEVDNYLIFTNRKYTGIKGERLLKKIKNETALQNVEIIGKETINRYLNQNKNIVKLFELNKHHIPFDFSEEEIKDIILEFKKQLSKISEDIKTKVEEVKYDFDKIEIEEKNKKNLLSKDYFENEILSRSLLEFTKIQIFLEDDKNSEFRDYYFDITSELSALITLKRDNFDMFDEVLVFIYQKLADNNNNLKGGKRHISTLLHYMYMNCEIGLK